MGTEIMGDFDVVVCGGGPAGAAAAITAARKGYKVCLVERYGCIGGMATTGLVNPFMGYVFESPSGKQGSLITGLFKEIITALKKQGAMDSYTTGAFDEEYLKVTYDRFLKEAKVKVYLHSQIIAVETSNDRVESIVIASKTGPKKIKGKIFIDSTGDGDIAAWAGCEYTLGRSSDNLTQAMTLCFRIANVNKASLFKGENSHLGARKKVEPYFQEAREKGILHYPYRDFIHFYDYPRPGILHFNMTRINRVSGLSIEDLSKAEAEGRRQAYILADWLTKYVPFFKDAYLEKLAVQIGVRETRHIKGLYTMTYEDIVQGRKFEDGIVRSAYPIDIHSPTGSGFEHEIKGSKGKFKETYKPPAGDYYEVPFRSIICKNIENLLIACRALSADHKAGAAVRVMATMTGLGEAAGIAAAKAVERNQAVNCIDGSLIKKELRYLNQGPDYDDLWQQ